MLLYVALLVSTVSAGSPYAVNGVEVDGILDRMTTEEKVGQLLFLGFGGKQIDPTITTFLEEMKPGGVALFGRNIDTPEQTMRLIRDVRGFDPAKGKHAPRGVPMFVSVDQEGGNVVRLKTHATVLPSNMALGATASVDLARGAGEALGRDLAVMGFNMNLAPVLDVNSNPLNPVIGIRSFGEDPVLVGELGVAYIQGLQSQGVAAVAKHFPGHGDTDSDSHYALPVLSHDKRRLMDVELRPFARAFAEGLDAMMTAHIALPSLAEEPDLPSTVSKNVLTSLLRDELGYDGLVITDGLEMQGIVSKYGSGEAAVRAVLAGADMVMVLWYPEKKREVKDALLAAVKSGRIPPARLDEAVRRVLSTKAMRGLFARELLPLPEAKAQLASAHRRVVDEIAKKAVTVVRGEGRLVPLPKGARIVAASAEPAFLAELARARPGTRTMGLPAAPTPQRTAADADKLVALAQGADVVVVGMMTADHAPIVKKLRAALPSVPVVVVSFGSPYLLSAFPDVAGYVCAFGFRDDSERAAARVLSGKAKAAGRLPVTLPGAPRAAFDPTTPKVAER